MGREKIGVLIIMMMLTGACASAGSAGSSGAEQGLRSEQTKSSSQDFSQSDDDFLNQRLQAEKTRGYK